MAEDSRNPPGSAAEIIFNEALNRPASERGAYLTQACGEDSRLRARVEALLCAAEAPEGFLPEHPGAGPRLDLGPLEADGVPEDEKPGDRIGRYRLVERIGEGGFGTVYVAEQKEPVKREVALKLIKLGMNTRHVVARFQAERQALALMDHPNIAKVFDAGATETGRPYFVMELVRATRITEYCDQHRLTTRQRLDLFIQVCRAVQHAHQKGIIHRDLKPSNILVALQDGVAVPKIIDFGIAKATQAELTGQTVFTQVGQFIGTPAYMSPEQAELSRLDVDTRSDIYSLGVLLYELLTGTTPFDTKELLTGGWEDLRQKIKHLEPARPSTRLSTLGAAELLAVADRRQIDPPRLIHTVRGDLDWIVMKCLEKDRQRRYETVNGLARDLERYVNNEPVLARPPSRFYEFQKTVRRHKVGFVATGAVIAALTIGVVVSTWQTVRARRAEHDQGRLRLEAVSEKNKALTEAAKSQEVARFLKDIFQGVAPSVARGRDATMLQEILDRAAERITKQLKDQPLVAAELQQTIGDLYTSIREFSKAELLQRQALETRRKLLGNNHADVAFSLIQLAITRRIQNEVSEAEALDREAVAICRKLFPNGHPYLADALEDTARVLENEGKLNQADVLVVEGAEVLRRIPGDQREAIAGTLFHLAMIRRRQGRYAEAEQLMAEQLPVIREHFAPDELAWDIGEFAALLRDEAKLSQAEAALKEELSIQRGIYTQVDRRYIATTLGELSRLLSQEGKFDEAEALQQEALSILQSISGDQRDEIARGLVQLSSIRHAQGKNAEAEKLLVEQLPTLRKNESPAELPFTLEELARIYMDEGKLTDAEASFREMLALMQRYYGQEPRNVMQALLDLAGCLAKEGKRQEAETDVRAAISIHSRFETDQRNNPDLASWIGSVLEAMGHHAEAEEWYRRGLQTDSTTHILGPNKWAEMVNVLADLLATQEKFAEVEAASEEWLQGMRARLPPEDPGLAELLATVASAMLAEGKSLEAERNARECVTIREKKLPDDFRTDEARSLLGSCLTGQKRYVEAEPLLLSGWQGLSKHAAQIHPGSNLRTKETVALRRLVDLYEAMGRADQAAEWKRRLQQFDEAETTKGPANPP